MIQTPLDKVRAVMKNSLKIKHVKLVFSGAL